MTSRLGRSLRTAWRWFAVILPPTWMVVLAIIFVMTVAMLTDFAQNAPGMGRQSPDPVLVILCAATLMWGFYRATMLNPMEHQAYRAWLATTPWRRGIPLPLGPVLPAPQDLAAMLLLFAWAEAMQLEHPYFVPGAYAAAWCLSNCWALLAVRETWGFAAGFALTTIILVRDSTPPSLALLAFAIGAVSIGLWRALARFPWDNKNTMFDLIPQKGNLGIRQSCDDGMKRELLGWPFSTLSPPGRIAEECATGRRPRLGFHGLLAILLLAWFFRCAGSLATNPQERAAAMIAHYVVGSASCVVILFLRMYFHTQPPLSFFGQIATGRLIIPSYHRMLLGPIGVLLVSVCTPPLLRWAGMSFENLLPLSAVAVLLAFFLLGPELHGWRLTCAHRAMKPVFELEFSRSVQVK